MDHHQSSNRDVSTVELRSEPDDVLPNSKLTLLDKMTIQIECLQAEKQSLIEENRKLCGQVNLMNAKLELTKQFLCRNVSVQTDIHIPTTNSETSFGNDFISKSVVNNGHKSELEDDCSDSPTDDASDKQMKIKSELDSFLSTVKSANEDYSYDPNSNTYYSRSTGWYYYPENSAFYDPQNRSFYKYDTVTTKYTYLYSIDKNGDKIEVKSKQSKSKQNPSKNTENIDSDEEEEEEEGELVEEEEGEIVELNKKLQGTNSQNKRRYGGPNRGPKNSISLTPAQVHITSAPVLRKPPVVHDDKFYDDYYEDDQDEEDDEDFDDYYDDHFEHRDDGREDRREHRNRSDHRRSRHQHEHRSQIPRQNSKKLLNKISPIRFIVQKSDSLDIGSLLLMTCLGGKVGQHSSCAVTIPDSTVSQIHAEIVYDKHRRAYTIQDLVSRNGTYINDDKLKGMQFTPLFHGDVVRFADCQLLAHIHQNRDVTCDDCEPGTTMQKYAQQQLELEQQQNIANKLNPTPKNSTLKSIKKKYGLEGDAYKEPEGVKLPTGYRNRAAKRQRAVGSDNPYEKTAAGSALDMPLDSRNKGFQMMSKMGWKTGQGLGNPDESGTTEPIDIELRDHRRGLGFGH